jgi:cytochrome P450
MKPHYHYDAIYALSGMRREEDKCREFFFDFINSEWGELKDDASDDTNSFIHHLMRVSDSGRNFTSAEILDHCGTMLVAVS